MCANGRFFAHGDFTKAAVAATLAPAMDITIPSNFERFLFHHSGNNAAWLKHWMGVAKDTVGWVMGGPRAGVASESTQLSAASNVLLLCCFLCTTACLVSSCCTVVADHVSCRCGIAGADAADPTFLPRARELFTSFAARDETIRDTVAAFIESAQYVLCPHSAAGVAAGVQYLRETRGSGGDGTALPLVCMATAHPGKFGDKVVVPLGRDGSPLPPALPQCLANILELPTRCASAPNSAAAVRSIVEAGGRGEPTDAVTASA